VGIVEFVTIFFVGSPFLLWPLVGKVERGITAQFADQVQGALPDHLEGIIVAKGTVHEAVDRDKVNSKQQEQAFEPRLDLQQIGGQFNLSSVFVLASFGTASFPGLFFDLLA
jgi:hypothetical protein